MPTFFKIDKERRLVMSTGSGVVTMADAMAHQTGLLNDPDFDPGFSQLLDLTQVETYQVTIGDVRKLAQAKVFSPDSRRAILVTNDYAFGAARVFESLRGISGEKRIRVFRDLDEALDWILFTE
jgi:hypothetical protein